MGNTVFHLLPKQVMENSGKEAKRKHEEPLHYTCPVCCHGDDKQQTMGDQWSPTMTKLLSQHEGKEGALAWFSAILISLGGVGGQGNEKETFPNSYLHHENDPDHFFSGKNLHPNKKNFS